MMCNILKRTLAVLLVMVMLVGVLPGISVSAATVNYATDTAGDYVGIIKNWGERGELATFLSPNAEDFYAEQGVAYEEYLAMSGSSDTALVADSQLYKALYELMSIAHTTVTDYNDTTEMYRLTDCQNSGDHSSSISGFYSGIALSAAWDGGLTWNREHTWPQSKSANGDDIEDIMSIRPESSSVNSSRGNKAYGVSSGYYNPNSVSGGTYDVRGDVARVVLYTYVRWGGESETIQNNMWGTEGVIESVDVLLDWMEEDPVDTWEMGRNDSVESITGTRNVFVDYPEMAFVLFDAEIPEMDTPSGNANSIQYTITAISDNSSYGTVSVNDQYITAHPHTGYKTAGYELVSGNASVTQNGDIFTVSAAGDCTIRILFEAKPQYTATFLQDGTEVSARSVYGGNCVAMPAFSGELPEGYTFRGWTTSVVYNTATKPANIYPAGSECILQGDTTFYALLSWVNTEDTGAGELTYKLVTSQDQLRSGASAVIVASAHDKAMSTTQNTNNRGAADVTKGTDTLIFDSDAGVAVLTLETGTVDGTYGFNTGSGYIYAASKSSNQLKTKSTLDDNGSFEITVNSDGTCTLIAQGANTRNNLLYNSQSNLFACYSGTSNNVKTVALYVGVSGGTTYYTMAWTYDPQEPTEPEETEPEETECSHANENGVYIAPTCTEQGYTAYFCADCGEELYIEDYVAAQGHSYLSAVTDPTFSAQGYTTHTCSVCGDSYVDSYTAPLTNVAGWSLTLGSDLSVNFKINVDASIRPTAQIHITVASAANVYAVSELTADADGSYYISVNVAAAQMTDQITVQIVNGTDQSEMKTYSVRTYADTVLAGDYSEETKALVTQMLHYGAAAQSYFGYHTDDLANAGLEPTSQTAPTADKAESYTGAADGITYAGATLLFRDKIAVRYYFDVTGDVSTYSFTVDGNSCTPVKKGDRCYIEVADINPQDLDESITVQVNENLTVVYSPMNYIVNMCKKGSEKLQSLVQALYAYHLAAKAYVNA